MLARPSFLRVMSAALALAAVGGCSLADELGSPNGGASAEGGSSGQPTPSEVGYEETELGSDPPTLGGGSSGADVCDNGVRFEMAPNATHGRVSAAFAVAALQAGTWPNINRSLLRHDEFLAYFARSPSNDTPFARVRATDEGQRLDVFVTVPPDNGPTHLIVVVDTSTSMRNDLPLAGEIVAAFGKAVALDQGDFMTVVEWGSAPRIFATEAGATTVPAAEAPALGAEFGSYALELTKAQLGPGGSLGPAQAAVEAAIDAGPETPHIVVLTDGGVEADGDAFAAIESWATKRNAVISFIEIAGGSGEAMAAPQSFHREQLASMALAGGGLTHFVTRETLETMLDDFEGNFLVGRRRVQPRYDMPGITALVSTPDLEFAAGEIGSTFVPRWSGRGRPVFTSVGVETCGLPEFEGKVYLDEAELPVLVGDQQDARVARLARIDQLFEILRRDCAGAKDLIAAFGEVPEGDTDLRELVDQAATACEADL